MAEITPKESLRLFCVECLSSFFVFDQLDAIEEASSSDVSNDREVSKRIIKGSAKDGLVTAHVTEDVFALKNFDVLERYCSAHRVPAEGIAVEEDFATFIEGVVDTVRDHHRSKWRVSGSQTLGKGQDVGGHVELDRTEPFTEPTKGTNGLIEGQQDAVAGADLANSLEVARGRHEATTSILHRLQEDDGNGVRALAKDCSLNLVRRPHAEGVDVVGVHGCSVEVGIGDLDSTRNQWFEGRAIGVDRGD